MWDFRFACGLVLERGHIRMNNIGKYEKSVAKAMLKKLLSLNLIDENEFRMLVDNISLDIEKKLCVMHS